MQPSKCACFVRVGGQQAKLGKDMAIDDLLRALAFILTRMGNQSLEDSEQKNGMNFSFLTLSAV